MGTWGDGNLDSDYAFDELSTRTTELLTAILQRAQRKESREFDEYDYTTLFVELEIAFALDAAKLLREAKFPAGDAVRALAQDFIADWAAYMGEDNATPAHVDGRRAVILESFERFAKICEAQGGQGPIPPLAPPKKPAKPKTAKKPAKKPTKKPAKRVRRR
jgi:hypothetical protein